MAAHHGARCLHHVRVGMHALAHFTVAARQATEKGRSVSELAGRHLTSVALIALRDARYRVIARLHAHVAAKMDALASLQVLALVAQHRRLRLPVHVRVESFIVARVARLSSMALEAFVRHKIRVERADMWLAIRKLGAQVLLPLQKGVVYSRGVIGIHLLMAQAASVHGRWPADTLHICVVLAGVLCRGGVAILNLNKRNSNIINRERRVRTFCA